MLRSSERSLRFRFSNQNIVCISHLSHACYMLRPSHHPSFITLIIFGEACNLWSFSLDGLTQSFATSALLGSIFSSTLFSKFHTHTKQQIKVYFCIF
jgi:hypothetical protein